MSPSPLHELRVKQSKLTVSAAKKRRDLWGLAMLALSIILFSGLFYARIAGEPEEIGDNFCVKGKAPSRQVVVLVDQTDPFRKDMQRRVMLAIEGALKSARRGEMFSLFYSLGLIQKVSPQLFRHAAQALKMNIVFGLRTRIRWLLLSRSSRNS